MKAIDDAVASHTEHCIEYRVVRRDGKVRWLRDRGRIVLDDHDTPRLARSPAMRRLRQVLWNLLANGVKFTPTGGRAGLGWPSSATSLKRTAAQ